MRSFVLGMALIIGLATSSHALTFKKGEVLGLMAKFIRVRRPRKWKR